MRFSVGHSRGITVQALGIEPKRIGLLAQALVGLGQFEPERRQRGVEWVGRRRGQPRIHGEDACIGQGWLHRRDKPGFLGWLFGRRIPEERIGCVRQPVRALHVAHGLGAVGCVAVEDDGAIREHGMRSSLRVVS